MQDVCMIQMFYVCHSFCITTKGKPPTKKAKVLQKQPLMAKLAAYAQYQASQQNQAKSKSGRLSFSVNIKSFSFTSI